MCVDTYNHTNTTENHQKQNYWQFSPDQSKLVWLSELGTALVCGLPQSTEWAQKGDSLSLPIGPVPPPHFLLDLTTRHLPDSNYRSVSSSSSSGGPPQQRHLIPAMNHTANCSITSTITHLKKNKRGKEKKKKKKKRENTEVGTNLTC